jgi:S-adenosylmethionine:tRNA ribosyltransferase-isomerase
MSILNYTLPDTLIAQSPAQKRDESRLMIIDRSSGQRRHKQFKDILSEFQAGDLLVLNDTAVFPARLKGHRSQTGGKVEVLMLDPGTDNQWTVLMKCGGKPKVDEELTLAAGSLKPRIVEKLGGGQYILAFPEDDLHEQVDLHGEIPLPPYIEASSSNIDHKDRYQTVYAESRGAVAAPTAGLHFTQALLDQARAKGVEIATVTLHVGLGTFMPIRDNIDDHVMHSERYIVPPKTLHALDAAKTAGRRIIACGTTSVRTLESYAKTGESHGATRLFIQPPYEFQLVSGLITNFHLPQTTLLLLVGAFLGEKKLIDAYKEAIEKQYRFYSYGDSMLIL